MTITHKEYVTSPYWRKFSKKMLDDENVECAMCKRKKWSIYKVNTKKHKKGDKKRLIVLNLHHVNYKNLGIGEDDVLPLCRRCHSLSHDIERAGKSVPFWLLVYKTLLDKSGWRFEPTDKYEVPDDFVLSKKRGKKK